MRNVESYEHIIVKLKGQKEIFAYDKAIIELDKDFIIVKNTKYNYVYFFGNKKSVDYARYNIVDLPDVEEQSNKKG